MKAARPRTFIQNKRYCVYALLCPVELTVKYIGLTENLTRRESAHYMKGQQPTEKLDWILHLRSLKLRPIPIVLKEFNTKRIARIYESELIITHKAILLNQEIRLRAKYENL